MVHGRVIERVDQHDLSLLTGLTIMPFKWPQHSENEHFQAADQPKKEERA